MGCHVAGDGMPVLRDRCAVITVIGEAMVTLMPEPDSSLMQASPGGSAFTTEIGRAHV